MPDQTYYVASLKHTNRQHEHITWWGINHCGYTPVVGDQAGTYSQDDAAKLNDGVDCLAVPVEVVRGMLSPEPYFRPSKPMRFYDQRGPVVDNTRAAWNALVEAAKPQRSPKPAFFRGTRRSFALAVAS